MNANNVQLLSRKIRERKRERIKKDINKNYE